LEELKDFFEFLQKKLLRLKIMQAGDNHTMLKVCNSILKRISKSTHHELRGRVQILLASILRLGDKSGLNKKSLINVTTTQEYLEADSHTEELSDEFKKFYYLFLKNIRFLGNPYLLLDEEKIIDKKEPEQEYEEGEIKSNASILLNFLSEIKELLIYFKNNPIDPDESVAKRFPKYLKDPLLFPYQLQEPFFRKTVLTQLKMTIFSSLNPLKSTQKSFGPFSDSEKKNLKEYSDLIDFLLKVYKVGSTKKGLDITTDKILNSEKSWMDWKDGGCLPFDRHLPSEKYQLIKTSQSVIKSDDTGLLERAGKVSSWMSTDEDYSHMDALDKSNLMITESPIETGLSRFMMGIVDGSDPDQIDDLKNNVIHSWRTKRAIFRDNLLSSYLANKDLESRPHPVDYIVEAMKQQFLVEEPAPTPAEPSKQEFIKPSPDKEAILIIEEERVNETVSLPIVEEVDDIKIEKTEVIIIKDLQPKVLGF